MKITVCDICGKPLESPTTIKLPYKDIYHATSQGKVAFTFTKNPHLEDYDLCNTCFEQIYEFIQLLKENETSSEFEK